jgi:CDP-glucose 4,6-dehydratase
MMKAFLENRTAVIRNPAAIRPWQHVLDPLSGYLILAERLWDQGTEFGEGWNFGPGEEDARPVSWVAETAVRLWGERAQWELIDPQDQLPEAVCLKLDCSKAGTRLGWSPRLRLAQALDWTIEWYKEFGKGGNMRLLTEEQIKRFEGLS